LQERPQPEVFGDASTQHGAAAVPRFGVSLHDVMLAVHGDGRMLNLDGEAHPARARSFMGMLAPGAEGWRGNATITGQDLVWSSCPRSPATSRRTSASR
jgi:hypothetical protein